MSFARFAFLWEVLVLVLVIKLTAVECTSYYYYTNASTPTNATLSSLTTSTTYIVTDPCALSSLAWNSAWDVYWSSISGGIAAGQYSTTAFVTTAFITETDPVYSLAPFETDTLGESYKYTYAYATFTTEETVTQTLFTNTYTRYQTPSFTMSSPTCTEQMRWPATTSCGDCTLEAQQLQLIYFPVTTAPGNRSSILASNVTGIQTAYINGTTYTSGMAYLKYDEVEAYNSCGYVGTQHSGAVVTLPSSSVMSLLNDGTMFGTDPQSFNFADLISPVPWSAWFAVHNCNHDELECGSYTYEAGSYNPYVSIPAEVRGLDSAWANCVIEPNAGSWDPPYALQPVLGGMITASTPIVSTPPSAGATALPATASPTTPSMVRTMTPATMPSANDPPSHDPSPSTAPPNDPPPSTPPSDSNASPTPNNPASPSDPSPNPIPSDPVVPSSNPPSPNPVPSDPVVPSSNPPADPSGNPVPDDPASPSNNSPSDPNSDPTPNDPTLPSSSPNPDQSPNPGLNDPTQPSSSSSTSNSDPAFNNPAILSVKDQTLAANSPTQFIIGSQTVAPGAASITVSNFPISLDPSASVAVVGTTLQTIHNAYTPNLLPPAITVGSQIYTANSVSDYVIGSQTLVPGGSIITMSDMPVSLASSALFVVVGSSTMPLAAVTTAVPDLTFGGYSYTMNSASDFIIGSQTLFPGAVITISGTPISLAPSASFVVIGSSTVPLAATMATSPPMISDLTFAGETFTINSVSDFVIDGQTLNPGAAITISGTLISLAPAASFVVVGSSTILLATATATISDFTFDDQTYTMNSMSDFVIDGQTLDPGTVITISGTPISLAADPTDVVIGTSTQGIGAFIMSGFGGVAPSGGNANGSGTVTPFLGNAKRESGPGSGILLAGCLGLAFISALLVS